MVALRLFHVDVDVDDVSVEEGGDDVHLFNLEVMMTCEGEEDTKSSVTYCGGKDGGVVKVLHVATSHEMSFALDGVTSIFSLDLVLPEATNNMHRREEGDEGPCVLFSE